MSAERYELNKQLAQMLKGGVIMDVTTPEQARIAEEAGACAVMALERIPADIRAAGGVSRMSDPKMIKEIQEAVSIPVMAKCRIGRMRTELFSTDRRERTDLQSDTADAVPEGAGTGNIKRREAVQV